MYACTDEGTAVDIEKQQLAAPTSDPEIMIGDTPTPIMSSEKDEQIRIKRNPIEIQSIKDISEITRIVPYSPSYNNVSNNGMVAAVGNSQGVQVFDIHTNEILMDIPVKLKMCDFGKNHPIQLNSDGSFLAIAGIDLIQVWKVGGDKVYEQNTPLYRDNKENICGMEIPEISISPDGNLLVLAGFEQQGKSPAAFFRVIRILDNKIIYQWEGEEDKAHGWIYNFPNLGFSPNGTSFQTFDSTRFLPQEGNLHEAFRFWDTRDWSDISQENEMIRESYPTGSLLFGLSEKQKLEVKSRLDGRWITTIESVPCDFDYPCTVKFSADGERVIVFFRQKNSVILRNHRYSNQVSIYDLQGDQEEVQVAGLFRNLDGIFFNENGALQVFSMEDIEWEETWWTYSEYFSGLIENGKGEILFSPIQNVCAESEFCHIAHTCFLDSIDAEIYCQAEYISDSGNALTLQFDEENLLLMEQIGDSNNIIGKINVKNDFNPFKDRIRLLGYSDLNQVGFYCLDKSYRQEMCAILDFSTNTVIQEMDDISYLRFSPSGSYAVFIDEAEKRLNLMDLNSREITTKMPYQARAFPVNPVFIAEEVLLYIVQNIENPNQFGIEYIDMTSLKTLGRKNIDMKNDVPIVFSSDSDSSIWFVGDDEGWIKAFEAKTGKNVSEIEMGENPIIGLILSHDNTNLVAMDRSGNVSLFGVIK